MSAATAKKYPPAVDQKTILGACYRCKGDGVMEWPIKTLPGRYGVQATMIGVICDECFAEELIGECCHE